MITVFNREISAGLATKNDSNRLPPGIGLYILEDDDIYTKGIFGLEFFKLQRALTFQK